MTLNLSTVLFIFSMITGTMITITANSWIIMWVGLEMNLLSFIPMMNTNRNPYENEASMKYFLIQAMASLILLASILISNIKTPALQEINMMLTISLLMKMGAAPFHFWFPGVMQGITWNNIIILMTWQKIAPMIMLGYQIMSNMMNTTVIILSLIVGSIGGLNQTSLSKLMAYSSIGHLGWMIAAMYMSNTYWTLYFTLYTLLNIAVIIILQKNNMYHLSQTYSLTMSKNSKFILFMSMLSLGGMPPFLGFIPKWIIIQNMSSFHNNTTVFIMLMTTLLTLYFYMSMMYSAFTFNNPSSPWSKETPAKMTMSTSVMISLLGIPLISMINLY